VIDTDGKEQGMRERDFMDEFAKAHRYLSTVQDDGSLSQERKAGMYVVASEWMLTLMGKANNNQRIWVMDNYPKIYSNYGK
jgi:hypothetical protein